MPSLSSLRKQAEKAVKESEGKAGVGTRHIQGLMLESDLAYIDQILIKDLKFIRADGTVIDYVDPPEDVSGKDISG